MNITMAISINCEIEINITIHAPALLSFCQNSYYELSISFHFSIPIIAAMFVSSRMIFARSSIVAAILLKYYNYTHAFT